MVSEGGDVYEVSDGIVLAKCDGKGEVDGVLTHGLNRHHEVVCPFLHFLQELWMSLLISEDGMAQCDGSINLLFRRVNGFEQFILVGGGVRRGKGKVCKICINL